MAEMRQALIRSEGDVRKKLMAQNPAIQAGIWIDQMTTSSTLAGNTAGSGPSNPPREPVVTPVQGGTGETNVITLVCRAVNLTSVDTSANSAIAYAVENEIKASPLVDPKATQLVGQITTDDATGTFTFTMNVAPVKPMNF